VTGVEVLFGRQIGLSDDRAPIKMNTEVGCSFFFKITAFGVYCNNGSGSRVHLVYTSTTATITVATQWAELRQIIGYTNPSKEKSKSEVIPVRGPGGLWGSKMLSIPHFLHTWWLGCQPYEPAAFSPQRALLVLISC
jgi:hypothetical protein